MKINKFIGLLACTMAFTACQNDMLEADMQQNKIYTLSGKMSGGKTMSRAQVELGNSNSAEEYAYWNEGDAFALYQNINDNLYTSVFTISGDYSEAGVSRQSATFTTDNPAELGVDYIAVYPAGLTVNNGRVDMNFNGNHLDFSGATSETERAAVWKGYMNRYMYMLAKGKLVNGEPNVVSFQHLCAMFRVTYSNETEAAKDISELSFTGDMFSDGITYNLMGKYQSGSGATSNYSTSFSGLTVQPGETVDLYVFLFPHEFNPEGEVQVNLNINSAKQTVTLPTSAIQAANGGATGFEAGKRYWFKVTENAEGLVWTKDASQGEEEEVAVIFTNKELSLALYNVLGADMVTLNEDNCAVMSQKDVNSVKQLDFYQRGLTSLEGIEEFVNLENFVAGDCYLTGSIKVTNSKLRKFDVYNNDITHLDVSGLSQLETLVCSENGSLGNNINIEGTNLKDLQFHHTGASSLDFIPKNLIAQIENFDCGTNKFTSLDLSAYTSVKNIWISDNGLTELILPKTETLEILDMTHNPGIASVDLTIYPNLKEFYNQQNNLESIDVSKCPELYLIFTNSNKLTELDLTNNPKIEHLICGEQQDDRILTLYLPESLMNKWNNEWKDSFTNVVLGNESGEEVATVTIENTDLAKALYYVLGADKVTINDYGYAIMKEEDVLATEVLDFDWGQFTITSLNGIEHFVNLTTIIVADTGLETCDFSQNTKLTHVNVQSNNLTYLDLSHCPELNQLYVQYMPNLTKIDLTGCTKLWNFQAQGTGITSLDIPNPAAMDNFLIPSGLTVDLSLYTNLTGLGLDGRGLDNLDMIPESLKGQLGFLKVDNNNLTTLDLTEYPKLWGLNCGFNLITTLDITNCPLTSLDCTQQNQINLTLTLTEEQKLIWDSDWSNSNSNVTLNVVASGLAGGGITEAE